MKYVELFEKSKQIAKDNNLTQEKVELQGIWM